MWESVGVTTKGFIEPYSAYRPNLVNRTPRRSSHWATIRDYHPCHPTTCSSTPSSGLNLGFEHPWFTEKLAEAGTTLEEDARWAILAEMAEWMFDNVMVLPLYRQATVAPVGREIDTWTLQALGSNLAEQL